MRRPSHLFYFAVVVVVVVVVVRRDLIHNDSIFLLDFGTLWKFIAPRLSSEGMESIRNEFGFVFEVMQSTRVIRNFFFYLATIKDDPIWSFRSDFWNRNERLDR